MKKKMLVAYSGASTHTATTLEYLLSLQEKTDFDVDYVHVTHDAVIDFDINAYDIVFSSYCVRLCFEGYISSSFEDALKRFLGLKIAAIQDEYDRTAFTWIKLRELGFHLLLTCVQPEYWNLVYPKSEVPGLKLIHVLTGYLPNNIEEISRLGKPLRERTVKVAYRGGHLSPRYGKLASDKYEIGARVALRCKALDIAHDISMDASDRVYGDDWYRFVGESRTMLGAESGSNVFDFDGSVERKLNDMSKSLARTPTFEEFEAETKEIESFFNVGQISPRVFECAVLRTPMILFRGQYSGALEPDVDYICLEKDFSNLEAVLKSVDDFEFLEKISTNAYDKLVESGRYGYSEFGRIVTQSALGGLSEFISEARTNFMRSTVSGRAAHISDMPRQNKRISNDLRKALRVVPSKSPMNLAEFYDIQIARRALHLRFPFPLQRFGFIFLRWVWHKLPDWGKQRVITAFRLFRR